MQFSRPPGAKAVEAASSASACAKAAFARPGRGGLKRPEGRDRLESGAFAQADLKIDAPAAPVHAGAPDEHPGACRLPGGPGPDQPRRRAHPARRPGG